MNDQQKETLRDCFEGCMTWPTAKAIALGETWTNEEEHSAHATWWRWVYEMEEEGSYIY